MQSTCKFFQWADETNANASYRGDDDDGGGDGGGTWGGGNRGGGNWGGGDWGSSSSGRGRGRGGNAPKKPRAPGAKRKCGICGTEGTF